jgi:uncharacterized protein (DUF4213/DUF364 family)
LGLKDEFRKIVTELEAKYKIPFINNIFFPPFHEGGQPKDCVFMAVCLQGGAAGISYVLLPDEKKDEYNALNPAEFVGKDPCIFALEFGKCDPVKEMISLAAINAICQHVMRETRFKVDSATDSVGLLSIRAGDRVGMVGLFPPLIETVQKTGAELIVIEKKEALVQKYPELNITLDATNLSACNKILCTSTTILNNTLDDILSHCSPNSFISVIGPTAGYFPDPLFARGVDVVGGRVIKDGALLLQLLSEGKRWGEATQKICFQKKTYHSILD